MAATPQICAEAIWRNRRAPPLTTDAARDRNTEIQQSYSGKLADLQDQLSALLAADRNALFSVGGSLVLTVAYARFAFGSATAIALGVPTGLGICVLLFRRFSRLRRRARKTALWVEWYERGMERLNGTWQGRGNSGEQFTRDGHLYAQDLALFGSGSLFELLCTTRSNAGAERLAHFLLNPPSPQQARERQEAVRELSSRADIREAVALTGKYRFQDCDPDQLRNWLQQPMLRTSRWIPAILLLCSVVTAGLGAAGYTGFLAWHVVLPLLVPGLLVQSVIALRLNSQVRPRLSTLRTMSGSFTVLRDGCDLLNGQRFSSANLAQLAATTCGARQAVERLERMLRFVGAIEDPLIYGFSLWLGLGTHVVIAVEHWRKLHGQQLKSWLNAWAEFDALHALGTYAHEHPKDCFPNLVEGKPVFEARELGHPLLPDTDCVRNSLSLNDETAFYLISGSNMSGKSTLLRAMGINTVLSWAGAPVRAAEMRLSVFQLCASISIADSLLDGRSKFLAEVERLREAVRLSAESRPVLFLIDEMLSGTNSTDRRIAAASIIEALVAGNAVGAVSTHDLTLAEIPEKPGLLGANVHMQSDNPLEPLDFDYRLKPGVVRQSNAISILKMVGLPGQAGRLAIGNQEPASPSRPLRDNPQCEARDGARG